MRVTDNMLKSIKIPFNKRVSFDFDGTLDDDFDGTINSQKQDIQKICKYLVDSGYDVCIITKRYGPDKSNEGVVNEHIVVYELARELGIPHPRVFFTDREYKHGKIKELGVGVHFENAEYECWLVGQVSPDTLVVHVEDPYWMDLIF